MLQNPGRLFIDGQWSKASTDRTFAVADSATEEIVEVVPEAMEVDVDRAIDAARRAFDKGPWPRMSHLERATYMRSIADELDKRAEQHARLWTSETGILLSASRARMETFSGTYRYYASLAETYPFQDRYQPEAEGSLAIVDREPVGVVGAIVAWNGAPGLISSKVAPALLAGCTVVVKASPEAPGPAYILAEACEAAGLPAGVVNVVTADRDASERLVRNPSVDKIAFTGSTAAGRRIGAICGERVARCTLELGGKSPAIILDDYDIETAARTIASRATFLTGQVCFSLTRIIVARERHDQMVEALAELFRGVVVGDPRDSAVGMGPLATAAQRDRVEYYLAQGKACGATLATGGGRPGHLAKGYYVEPTVFGNVDNASQIAREEIFGPVLCVIPSDSEEQAVAIANDTDFGLNASVFTADSERAYAVAKRIRAGTVGHNGARREHRLPFGGFKMSGLGREGGTDGLLPYLESKVVILDDLIP